MPDLSAVELGVPVVFGLGLGTWVFFGVEILAPFFRIGRGWVWFLRATALGFGLAGVHALLEGRRAGLPYAVLCLSATIALAAWLARRRDESPAPRVDPGVSGLLGLGLVGVGGFAVVAYAWVPGLGLALGALSVGIFGLSSWRERNAARDGLRAVRERLEAAGSWTRVYAPGHEPDGNDVSGDDRVTGLWDGCRVRVAIDRIGIEVYADLPGWPRGATADAHSPALTPDVRARLAALVREHRATIAPDTGELALELSEIDGRSLPAVLDAVAALARALPTPNDDVRRRSTTPGTREAR